MGPHLQPCLDALVFLVEDVAVVAHEEEVALVVERHHLQREKERFA